MSRPRRIALATVLAACLTAGLSACGAGNDAQTNLPQNVGDGVQVTHGNIQLLNVLVVAPPEGGTQAVVSMTISNTGPAEERLETITSDAGMVALTGDNIVPAQGTLQIGNGDAAAQATIDGFTTKAGESVLFSVDLSSTGEVPVETFVYPPDGGFADYTVETTAAP